MSAAAVDARFPNSPEEMGRSNFDIIFHELLTRATVRNDSYTMVNYNLQHAAALAYLGLHEPAREKILALLHRPEYSCFRNMILSALHIPTYKPHTGNIYL